VKIRSKSAADAYTPGLTICLVAALAILILRSSPGGQRNEDLSSVAFEPRHYFDAARRLAIQNLAR
jgi:hypothetical protein